MECLRMTPEVVLWSPQAHRYMHIHTHEHMSCSHTNSKGPLPDLTEGLSVKYWMSEESYALHSEEVRPEQVHSVVAVWLMLVSVVSLKMEQPE